VFSESIDQDDAESSDHFEVLPPHDLSSSVISNFIVLEFAIDKLADPPIQTASTKVLHWLESGVQKHGSPND
jgi:hypothetical protein